MIEEMLAVFDAEPRVGYALIFGSSVKGTLQPHSDVDVAVGLIGTPTLSLIELGQLAAALEAAARRPVDLVLLEEAPPGLAYRIFRDGRTIFTRDQRALSARRARAILEYLDFRPIEELCAQGVLARAHGR